MTYTRQLSDYLLFGILVFCIFSFKINVINTSGTAVRLDDVMIAVAFLLLVWGKTLFSAKLTPLIQVYIFFILVNALSVLLNSYEGRVNFVTSALFTARLCEYLIFYFIGQRVEKCRFPIETVLNVYLVFLLVVIPLQMSGLMPSAGPFSGITSRAIGNLGGPYSLAVVAGFLLCYLGYQKKRLLSGFAAFVIIILSASRITFLGSLISIFLVNFKRVRIHFKPSIAAFITITVMVSLGVLIINKNSPTAPFLQKRISNVFSGLSLHTIESIYKSAPLYKTSAKYAQGDFLFAIDQAETSGGDISALIRIYRWSSLIKSTSSHLESSIFGMGPSFGTVAVDGYYVRVYAEAGVLGLSVFLGFVGLLLFRKKTSNQGFRMYALIMVVTAIFIDIFVSYKPMMFLWLWHGMNQAINEKESKGV